MDLSVSAIAGISRATYPVSSDTQIAVLQRRLEALEKQREQAAASSDETASYRLQALTQQMGLFQAQIGQLQQAASAAAQQALVVEPAEDEPAQEDSTDGDEPAETIRAARRDAAAVAKARAEGSLVGSNVDTYA